MYPQQLLLQLLQLSSKLEPFQHHSTLFDPTRNHAVHSHFHSFLRPRFLRPFGPCLSSPSSGTRRALLFRLQRRQCRHDSHQLASYSQNSHRRCRHSRRTGVCGPRRLHRRLRHHRCRYQCCRHPSGRPSCRCSRSVRNCHRLDVRQHLHPNLRRGQLLRLDLRHCRLLRRPERLPACAASRSQGLPRQYHHRPHCGALRLDQGRPLAQHQRERFRWSVRRALPLKSQQAVWSTLPTPGPHRSFEHDLFTPKTARGLTAFSPRVSACCPVCFALLL
ncbi:hypothetical protein DACRYDRAFT_100821 [Dacryopinax primogenitus]|uniref:Uncharacterized protein n=1 Tax=Dacryopinax primogenitus (strain DJM 731) TaxID=1858805 RepID=M5FT92_DACPD|nr:uncharacterized protein DACRYDRAFT_100821 [Dacryopinax primogenitus]EJU00826.1 hypothetical protein DACRYDRAFT_100821 [Dacryopinax primogenitus]